MQNWRDYMFDAEGEHPTYQNIVQWMWRLTFIGLAAIPILFLALTFTNLPSVEQLENPRSELASEAFGDNGTVIGRYYTENRVPVAYDDISPNLVNALIATEDERYYRHSGIDFEALGRVFVKTFLLRRSSSGGASTITQQLAKLLFTGEKASGLTRIFQKLREWIIAVRLERKYTKEEIIAMYLNKFNFINGAYGIKAASEIYFNKSCDSLEVHEAALLVGMLKNPSLFNPLRRPEMSLQRRNVVLRQMQKNGFLSKAEYETHSSQPLGLNFRRQTHIDGLAPYFRMELAKYVKTILDQPEYRKSDGSAYDIYRDGLKIYTTIDPYMQQIAEEVMLEHMAKVQKVFFERWKKLDPWTYRSGSPNEVALEIRQDGLKKLIRASDRYQNLRGRYLSDVLDRLQKEIDGIRFSEDDREVERIIRESEKEGYLAELVSRNMISSTLAGVYRRVLNSPHFPTLRARWDQLQEAVKREFNTPVEMKVFAYNERMETDTVMSPFDSIKYHRMFLQTGILAVEPATGRVKVWIGGINHKYFQFDHININRQVGSTFKPFVYATAIAQQGISPCYQVYDVPTTIAPGDGNFGLLQSWTPNNSTGKYTYSAMNLMQGLRNSVNTVSVHLMKQLGDTEPVRGLIHQMGIDSSARYPNGRLRVPQTPAICLGATDLSVMEMTGAYVTFANNGVYNKPTFITRIEDRNGRVIYQEMPQERTALPPNANYVMVEMLRYSGTGLFGVKSDVGGKTGTTNDYVDGWFMGVNPQLVVGTWTGGEDRWIRFRSIGEGQGAHMAKPFFREFIKRLEADPNSSGWDVNAKFYRPPGDLGIELNCNEYQRRVPRERENFDSELFTTDIFGDEQFDN
ncbi:MAG TPA: transglycosylase domain-containing protein [Saprospiraceae bacterium]|nr:transglycosylase domain-containing protein [Saprospiraceae bacterium]